MYNLLGIDRQISSLFPSSVVGRRGGMASRPRVPTLSRQLTQNYHPSFGPEAKDDDFGARPSGSSTCLSLPSSTSLLQRLRLGFCAPGLVSLCAVLLLEMTRATKVARWGSLTLGAVQVLVASQFNLSNQLNLHCLLHET